MNSFHFNSTVISESNLRQNFLSVVTMADLINCLDDDSLLLIFDQFDCPKDFLPLAQVCRRWYHLMTRFCRHLTALRIHVPESFYSLNGVAAKCPNIRRFHLILSMDGLSSDGLDRLPLLCPLIEEIHVSGFSFSGSTLARSGLCFPRLKKLVFGNVCNLEAKHLEVFCPLHPKLTHIEFVCNYPADSNGRIFLRSLSSPLRSFAMDNIVNGTLNSLGKRCIDSLETIKVRFLKEADEQRLTHQIFSTFHRLRNVSLYLWKGNLNDLPVLPCLQTFSLRRVSSCLVQDLIEFLRSYPHLKELHTKNFALNDELAEEVATNLPDLCSFSFSFNRLTSPGLMALTQLKQLKYFNMGFSSELSPTDVCAFVRQMPSLRRLVIENIHFPTLLKALRNEFRSCAFDRKLWVSQNDFKFFLVDPSEACTDEAIDKFDLKVDQYFDSDHASLISFYQI